MTLHNHDKWCMYYMVLLMNFNAEFCRRWHLLGYTMSDHIRLAAYARCLKLLELGAELDLNPRAQILEFRGRA